VYRIDRILAPRLPLRSLSSLLSKRVSFSGTAIPRTPVMQVRSGFFSAFFVHRSAMSENLPFCTKFSQRLGAGKAKEFTTDKTGGHG